MKDLYLISIGKLVRKHNNIYFITKDKKKKPVPLENISNIFILNRVSLTYPAIKLLTDKGILVHFFYEKPKKGIFYYMGTLFPRQKTKSGEILLKQIEAYKDIEKRAEISLEIVDAIRYNCIKVLEKYKIEEVKILRKIDVEKEFKENLTDWKNALNIIRGIEAKVWQIFYQGLDKVLKTYKLERRTRRPPKNEANAIVSFLNMILYSITLSEIYKTHLDPTISFLHEIGEKRFSLALDLSEPFKPILTFRILIWLVNQGIIKDTHFVKGLNGILLNEHGKKIVLGELNERLKQTIKLKDRGRKSLRYLIRAQAYNLEKALIDDRRFKAFRLIY